MASFDLFQYIQLLPATRERSPQTFDRRDSKPILFALSPSAACVHAKEGFGYRFREVQKRGQRLFRQHVSDRAALLSRSGHSVSFGSPPRQVQEKHREFDQKNKSKVDRWDGDQTVRLRQSLELCEKTRSAPDCDASPFLSDGFLL